VVITPGQAAGELGIPDPDDGSDHHDAERDGAAVRRQRGGRADVAAVPDRRADHEPAADSTTRPGRSIALSYTLNAGEWLDVYPQTRPDPAERHDGPLLALTSRSRRGGSSARARTTSVAGVAFSAGAGDRVLQERVRVTFFARLHSDRATSPFQRMRAAARSTSGGGLQEGVIGANDLKVSSAAPARTMSVDVAVGAAWVQIDTGTRNGLSHVYNDAVANVAVNASNATNPRIDQIIVRSTTRASRPARAATRRRSRYLTGTATAGATLDNRTGAAAAAERLPAPRGHPRPGDVDERDDGEHPGPAAVGARGVTPRRARRRAPATT
jgi:hypothetical protein